MDDVTVQQVEATTVMQQHAYVLFYVHDTPAPGELPLVPTVVPARSGSVNVVPTTPVTTFPPASSPPRGRPSSPPAALPARRRARSVNDATVVIQEPPESVDLLRYPLADDELVALVEMAILGQVPPVNNVLIYAQMLILRLCRWPGTLRKTGESNMFSYSGFEKAG